MTRSVLTLFTHMLLFKQANAYKSTTPELIFQPDTAIIKVCQKSDKTWCYTTRWHTLANMPGSFSDSQTLSIFNQSNVPLYCPTHDQTTLHDCKYSLRDAFQCIAQPNTTLLDCILYLMQYPYDPGTLPSSAN